MWLSMTVSCVMGIYCVCMYVCVCVYMCGCGCVYVYVCVGRKSLVKFRFLFLLITTLKDTNVYKLPFFLFLFFSFSFFFLPSLAAAEVVYIGTLWRFVQSISIPHDTKPQLKIKSETARRSEGKEKGIEGKKSLTHMLKTPDITTTLCFPSLFHTLTYHFIPLF